MMLQKRMSLLVFDTNYSFNKHHYEELVSKGVDLTRLFDLDELETRDLAAFQGLVAHPGMRHQRNFFQTVAKHPTLKVAVVSDEPGAYSTGSLDFSVFHAGDVNGIYGYFIQNLPR